MGFISVTTYNFRNLENSTVGTDSKNIFLVGENGQGKTNFLESVYNICYGNSFRTKYDSLLVREGEKEMSLKGIYRANSNYSGNPGIGYEPCETNNVFLSVSEGKKTILLNGKRIKDRKEIIHNIPCIVFSHDDISFINGSPERRRLFFNQTIGLFDPLFLDTLRRYEKILKNRNAAIREESTGIIEVYDSQLASEGLEITRKRKKAVEEFNETFSPVFNKVSALDYPIKIIYRPSWNPEISGDEALKIISSKREAEISAGLTLTGPHRDRFYFYMNKKDFTKIASTGQIRLVSLSLKSAQAEFYRKKTGKKPLVLLDDVLLELDRKRKIRFIDSFPEYEQAFFTFLPGEEIMAGEKDRIMYTVSNGVISQK